MTIEQYSREIGKFMDQLRIHYKSEILDPMGDLLNVAVESNMRDGGQYLAQSGPGLYFQTRNMPFKKVGSRTGKLARSLIPGQKDNIFEQIITDKKLSVEYGTKLHYAYYNEFGKTTPPNKKDIGYFWWAYKKSGIQYYKNLALAMIGGKTLKLKPRPFFNPGMDQFYKRDFSKLLENFIDLVKRKIF